MRLLTQREACAMLRVSRTTLLKLRKEEGLPYITMGKRLRYDEVELSEWLKQRTLSEEFSNQPAEHARATCGG